MDFFPQKGVLRFLCPDLVFCALPGTADTSPIVFTRSLSGGRLPHGQKKTEEETITQLRKEGGGNII